MSARWMEISFIFMADVKTLQLSSPASVKRALSQFTAHVRVAFPIHVLALCCAAFLAAMVVASIVMVIGVRPQASRIPWGLILKESQKDPVRRMLIHFPKWILSVSA